MMAVIDPLLVVWPEQPFRLGCGLNFHNNGRCRWQCARQVGASFKNGIRAKTALCFG
jgi:hypothetical protein